MELAVTMSEFRILYMVLFAGTGLVACRKGPIRACIQH